MDAQQPGECHEPTRGHHPTIRQQQAAPLGAHARGPMALVWITVARGVMAIVLGLALANVGTTFLLAILGS